ncbi:MAG TPA: transposase, partial [Candidatus Saccharimonadia bacterium]
MCFGDKGEQFTDDDHLADEYEYLVVDGIWVTVKGYGWESDKAVLLCALGIRPDGSRQILGFRVGRGLCINLSLLRVGQSL